MEAIGQLTGGVAHDFNNMLAGIVGNLQLASLHLKAGRTEQIARYLEGAERTVDRAATLTHRLLAFSRRQTLDPRPTDVEQLVDSMLDLMTRTVGPAIGIEVAYGSAFRSTYCDANQLENALLNLAINARDAMPGGGRLLIRTSDIAATASGGAEGQDFVRISIADNGSGMPPEVAGRAFEPFFTTKPLGQGTGLGLSMVFGFVSQSGGRVHLDSTPGAGTTIHLDLPRHHGSVVAAAPLPALATPGPAPRATILLVDDETALREVLAELLRGAGHEVVEAEDGPAALAQLARMRETLAEIDLLVTDVGLPGMNGRQLADAVRETAPATAVLFITGYAESTPGKDFLDPGMHIMVKPFHLDAFAARVAALVGEQRQAAPAGTAQDRL
ncbi:response regulator [Massilia sp. Dwa41.01b]|uniref:ATP-binding protein n=2 Tax=unclassified Massilia TaxID=2609279 RepID=UPI0016045208|nr:ATP-binding protein [Massilia sp. Dwa41.01b]QNA89966.1 response regulator [Massilia sp. Dwa41.01b]